MHPIPLRTTDILIEAWSTNEEEVRRTVGLMKDPNEEEVRRTVGLVKEPVVGNQNLVKIDCCFCFESHPRDKMYASVCGHLFCKYYWKAYVRTSIRNGPEYLLLQCPDASCDAIVGRDMVYLFVSDEEKKIYAHYILRSQVEANSKLYYIQQYIMRISSVLSVSKSTAGILLRHFKWNIDDVFDAWFDDEVEVREVVGLIENPSVQNPNSNTLTCRNCSEIYPRTKMFCVSCGHLFCTSCWSGYICKSIHEGPSCLTLRCLEATCNAAVDQEMVNSIVSDEEMKMYNKYVLQSYIEDNRKGLSQMLLFTEHTFQCYGNCVINYEDDILDHTAQACSDAPEGSIISGIDATQVIEPNDQGSQQKVHRRLSGSPVKRRTTFAKLEYYSQLFSEHNLYNDKKLKTLPSKPQDGDLYLLEKNWIPPLEEYFIAGHLTEQLKDDNVWVLLRHQDRVKKETIEVLYFMMKGNNFERRVYGDVDHQNLLLVQYAHEKKHILGPECDEMMHPVSALYNDRDAKDQTMGSASAAKTGALDRKRKAEGGLDAERRPEKYLRNADKLNLGQQHVEMIRAVSNLAIDKEMQSKISSSASAAKFDAVKGKKKEVNVSKDEWPENNMKGVETLSPEDDPSWDFNSCIAKNEKWIPRVKMKYKEKERDYELLAKEYQKLEKETNGLASLVKGYQNALNQSKQAFREYRQRYPEPEPELEEPLYVDAGPRGLVLTREEVKMRENLMSRPT